MTTPLSTGHPSSQELQELFAHATQLALQEGVPLHSLHLFESMRSTACHAQAFLGSQSVPARFPHGAPTHEPESAVPHMLERAERAAQRQHDETIHTVHLLEAMLRDSRCAAYVWLESCGAHVRTLRKCAAKWVESIPAVEPARSLGALKPSRSQRTTGSIGFHPSLQGLRTRAQLPPHPTPTTRRDTSLLDERSSPVHPALRDRWLRTTPSQGLPAMERPQNPDPKALLGPLGPKDLFSPYPDQAGTKAPACAHPEAAHPQGSSASLKERFAELKQKARQRRQPPQPAPQGISPDKIPPTVRRAPRSKAEEDEAAKKARQVPAPKDDEVIQELEAIEDARVATKSLAARLFGKTGAPKDEATAAPQPPAVQEEPPAPQQTTRPVRVPNPELAALYRLDPKAYPLLSKFGRNLTEEAALCRIDRAIGRTTEVDTLLDVLGKRRGNNPMLVGDAGVGKTAIVEGLAHAFVDLARGGHHLGGRTIVELELGRVLSGTHLRGSLSERLIALKDEVRCAQGKVVVFLDEIHTWLGAGQGGDGHDAAGELKTALARGHFPCIGATTQDEYTKFIEADPAFERRFQTIQVEEPDLPTAIAIAQGVREHYEHHHGVTYADAAVDAAVRLSHRYLHQRRLPDKAISVLDLAGSRSARAGQAYVRRSDIAHVIAEMASLPADRLTHSDRTRFMNIERRLAQSVVGHEEIVRQVAEVLRRNYAGFRSHRPIGSLLFLGPTGVGKTELVKALADFLFHDRDAIVRLDMSEFMESHAVSRFIGAPPGYVGYEQGGQLTEAVRKRPYQVILLDEIEKAHPDVLNLLLQLFDEGRLTDGRGRVVDFSNTLIVMTSNLGAQAFDRHIDQGSRIGFGSVVLGPRGRADIDAMTQEVQAAAQGHFAPELWARMDEKLVFMPLQRDEIAQIAVLQLESSSERLEQESGIRLEFSDGVIDHLICHGGYDRRHGARPMRHTIQRLVENELARQILSGQVPRGATIMIDVAYDVLTFSALHPPLQAQDALAHTE